MAGSEAREGRRAKPQFSAIIDIERPPEDVWRTIAPPERWFELYPQTRSRSHHYPAPDTRDAHPYRTRRSEEVGAHVTRSEASTVLEEDQEGRTFARHVRHRLSPSLTGTTVRVQDEIRFTGSAKPAAPIASRDIKRRWETSANARRQPPSAGRNATTG